MSQPLTFSKRAAMLDSSAAGNESVEAENTATTTITFWKPYISYVRQVPSLVWMHFVEGLSIHSLLRLNLISIGILSVAAFVSFLTSPDADYLFERMQHMNLGTRVEEMARTVELAIDSYGKVDPEVCLRMAACTLGKQNRRSSGTPDGSSVAAADAAAAAAGNSLDPQLNSSSLASASSKEVPRDNLLFVTIQLLDKLLRLVQGIEADIRLHQAP